MVIADFRAAFPYFTEAAFPDASVIFWSTLAEKQMSECRWGDLYIQGVMLYTAHELKLSLLGGGASSSSGVVTSKKVGDVSVNYDVSFGINANAGLWNRTIYGQQYWQLMQMVGMGAYQL